MYKNYHRITLIDNLLYFALFLLIADNQGIVYNKI